jgi:hypothetical protein
VARKRAGTVPLVSGPSSLLEPDGFHWKMVERAYGRSLSPEQRRRIFEVTQTYVAFRTREINSHPLRDSVRRVERLKKSAKSFRETLVKSDDSSDAHLFAHHQIKLQFSDDYLVAPDPIAGLTRVVGSFISACENALENHSNEKKHLDSIKAEGVPALDGTAWRNWIIELTSVVEEFGLPSGVRTDRDKNKGDESSPFVRLVTALQVQLPKKLQDQRQSEDALAKAINRARETSRRDKSSAISGANKSRTD